jgi:lipopolysaccharide export system permease protein
VLLHRLVFREILTPLVISLVLVSLLLIVLQMLSLNEVLFGSGFDPAGVLKVASYLAPHFGIIAVPLAFLLAIMLGIGRLAEDNELIALGAMGRSPLSLYVVPVLMSVGLGALVAQIAFVGEPWGLRGIHRQLNELIKRNVAGDIHPNTFSEDIPRFTIYIGSTSDAGTRWEHVFLHDSVGDGAPLLMLAQRGRIQSNGSDSTLRLALADGELHRISGDGGYSRLAFKDGTVALGVESIISRRNNFNRPAGELRLLEMPEAIRAARSAGDEGAARRLSAQFQGRLSAPFTCLIFGLIAVPLAATGRRSRGASFGATLLAFIGYYVLQTLGNGLGETGRTHAFIGAWLPNGVGLAVALLLAWRLRSGVRGGAGA